MIKFATFNILNVDYTYFNVGLCEKKSDIISPSDELLRNDVIIKLFENNEFDIIYLQEVSDVFTNLFNKSNLKDKFNLIKNKQLCMLLKKSLVKNITTINTSEFFGNMKYSKFVLDRIQAITGIINRYPYLLINVHLPSSTLVSERSKSIKVITNIINHYRTINKNYNIILAGDVNTSQFIFDKINDFKSIILPEIKNSYSTSFKLGICQNNNFKQLDRNQQHHFADDIYVTNKIIPNILDISSSFNENYKLVYERANQDSIYKFKSKGSPYCDPVTYTQQNICEIDNTNEKYKTVFDKSDILIKPWPSDHTLIYAVLNFPTKKYYLKKS